VPKFALWEKAIIFFQGFIQLAGVISFFIGVFFDNSTLTLIGGLVVTVVYLLEMAYAPSNPILPIFLSIILAGVLDPWYLGVFWALALLSSINTFHNVRKMLNPSFFLERHYQLTHKADDFYPDFLKDDA
jgi:hypothetical protein